VALGIRVAASSLAQMWLRETRSTESAWLERRSLGQQTQARSGRTCAASVTVAVSPPKVNVRRNRLGSVTRDVTGACAVASLGGSENWPAYLCLRTRMGSTIRGQPALRGDSHQPASWNDGPPDGVCAVGRLARVLAVIRVWVISRGNSR